MGSPESRRPRSDGSPSSKYVPKTESADLSRQTDTMNPDRHITDNTPSDPIPNQARTVWQRTRHIWTKYAGIDWPTYKLVFKGAAVPTIALSCFQANLWADYFTSLGYLVAIGAIITTAVQPRAKLLQTVLTSLFMLCLGGAVSMLALFCVIKARETTEDGIGVGPTSGLAAGATYTVPYNSSASAVAGVWLMVQVYTISALKAARPQFNTPAIFWVILANVGMTYAPQFKDMAAAEDFLALLMVALLTGMAIGTGVSLFVFPLTCRTIAFRSVTRYGRALQTLLKANMDYIHDLETVDMFFSPSASDAGANGAGSPIARVVRAEARAVAAAHTKLTGDLPLAKQEIAIGKLGPDDLQQVLRHLRQIMVPMVGLAQLSEIFHQAAGRRGWDTSVDRAELHLDDAAEDNEKARIESMRQHHEIMRAVRQPFNMVSRLSDQGIEHALLLLELVPSPKRHADCEQSGDEAAPGDGQFSVLLDKKLHELPKTKAILLRRWAELHGFKLAHDFFEHPHDAAFDRPEWLNQDFDSDEQGRYRRQLYISLYMEYLLYSVGHRVLDFVRYADGLKASGRLDKRRLIVPGYKRLRKWAASALSNRTDQHHGNHAGDDTLNVYLGAAFKKQRDPAHLPPINAWEQWSDIVRKISHFLASPPSGFALRVCLANMSIAVVAFLHDTQVFFTHQRLFWAMIMVSLSMQPTSGQSLRIFVFRIVGTIIAAALAWVAWYIVDGHAAGVLVFFWLFLQPAVYLLVKLPRWTTYGMVTQITMAIILGYELQVQKIGKAQAEANGQAFQPAYLLGAIRLATVAGGVFLSYLWSVFPYPNSEHGVVRQKVGASLYLLANFYSIMHETVQVRLKGAEGDMLRKDSPGRRLEKSRAKVSSKATTIHQSLHAELDFLKYDIPIGGKFPRRLYQDAIVKMENLLDRMQLVIFASSTFTNAEALAGTASGPQWIYDFRRVVGEANVTSQAVTTVLSLMSASIISGKPLPPYVRVPEPYQLSRRLDILDHDLLSIRHISEPGYASFAVIQIGTRGIIDDMKSLLEIIKELVGEMDFSYHMVSATDPGAAPAEETLRYSVSHIDEQHGDKRKPG